jgi:hypothetical protein
MEIKIEHTKKGLPALWECGGGKTNTGLAQIICNADGTAKKPVYIRRSGTLANSDHALFIISPGDLIIQAYHHRKDFTIRVFRIAGIRQEENTAILEQIYEYDMGEWNCPPPEYLLPAIEAAREKATCYHCRKPHFIVENE